MHDNKFKNEPYYCVLMLQWLKQVFKREIEKEDPMKYLIVGLGNMGAEYDNTRHNIGFEVVDQLANWGEVPWKNETHGDIAEVKHKGRTLVLLKPSTYMNRSGKSVRYWGQKKKILPENLLVIVDDLNLPLGQLRLKATGGDGGHNGLKDINQMLGTSKYSRLRVGIGNDFHKGQQVDFVLGKWTNEESEKLSSIIDNCVNAVKSYCTIGISRTMNQFNK